MIDPNSGWNDMGDGAAEAAPAPSDASSFTRGLRTNEPTLEGQARALAGMGGELFGAKEFAKDQYAQSKALQARAEEVGPDINSYKQVLDAPDLSTGMRRAWDYGTGLIGKSAIPLVAGLGAAALTRSPLKALAAATAATAPMEIGGTIQAQQNDPVQAAQAAGDRALNAGVVGTAKAALGNVVPVLAGGQALGRVALGGVERSLGSRVATNVVGDAAANAVAGAGSAKVGQLGGDQLNPNRDKTHDNEEMIEGAVAGAALGGPLGVLGGVGEHAHAKKEASFKRAGELIDSAKEFTTAKKIAADEHLNPETGEAGIEGSDKTAMEKTKDYVSSIMADMNIPDDVKQKVSTAAQDLTDAGNRSIIAAQALASGYADKVKDLHDRVFNGVKKDKNKEPFDPNAPKRIDDGTALEGEYTKSFDDVKKSEDYTDLHAKISDLIMPVIQKHAPELFDRPEQAKQLAAVMRGTIESMRSEERLPPKMLKDLHPFFGDDLPNVLQQVHEAISGKDLDKGTANFYDSLKTHSTKLSKDRALKDVITKNLVDPESATGPQVTELVSAMKKRMSDEPAPLSATASPDQQAKHAQRRYEEHRLDVEMDKHFGKGKEAVLQAFRDEHEGVKQETAIQAKKKAVRTDDADLDAAKAEAAGHVADEHGLETDHGDLKDQYEKPTLYPGKDSPFVPSHSAHVRDEFNESSQSSRLQARARLENPDRNVSEVSAREYADIHNEHLLDGLDAHAKKHKLTEEQKQAYFDENVISDEKLHAMTKGKPDDHVAVIAEGTKQEGGRLTKEQMEGMKLDSRNYAKSDARVNIGGQAYDATRITRSLLPGLQHIENARERIAQAFFEGVGGLMKEHGAAVDKDSPVRIEAIQKRITELEASTKKLEPTLKDVPPLLFEKIQVDRPVMTNGKETTERVSAKEAIEDIRKERDAYQALLACVGG